jgi:SAM domain (Sterile alpha motif)
MPEVADWLSALGMSEYAQRFADNDIDTAVLRHLTDQDLKELGVSLGHRRKMLAAIAQVAGAERTSPEPASTEPKPCFDLNCCHSRGREGRRCCGWRWRRGAEPGGGVRQHPGSTTALSGSLGAILKCLHPETGRFSKKQGGW